MCHAYWRLRGCASCSHSAAGTSLRFWWRARPAASAVAGRSRRPRDALNWTAWWPATRARRIRDPRRRARPGGRGEARDHGGGGRAGPAPSQGVAGPGARGADQRALRRDRISQRVDFAVGGLPAPRHCQRNPRRRRARPCYQDRVPCDTRFAAQIAWIRSSGAPRRPPSRAPHSAHRYPVASAGFPASWTSRM